jgi:GT2 family glycosyltransferase/glycosyltransferase involved in cell wall biosynthesis
LKPKVKVAFASGTDDLNSRLTARMREFFPELPLFVVSEFPPTAECGDPPEITWVAYRPNRSFFENLARCRGAFRGKSIRLAGVLLVPNVPYRRMRMLALVLAPLQFLAVNENLDHWMFRPRCAWTIWKHFAWRARNFVRWHFGRNGTLARRDFRADGLYAKARFAAFLRRRSKALPSMPSRSATSGISLIIPSRSGKDLLAAQLPGILRELPSPGEIIVVDNGSDDGTAAWLGSVCPQVRVEQSAEPLSFAGAVNRGIECAGYSHICLLNNDMLLDPGFFTALRRAFEQVPGLFCATAQIRFPAGTRREETGKAVMAQSRPEHFPIRCDEPLPGEDLTYVLYGSGGCSLYDAAKLRSLGGIDETYAPAYVEDLDLGYRAWQRGWPSVFVAGAVVEHRHRATTSRYYSETQLHFIVERNYLRFLARAVWRRALFHRLWAQATRRLWRLRDYDSLRAAASAVAGPRPTGKPAGGVLTEESFLALTNGSVSLFPGRMPSDKPRVLIVSPYLPFPLSHGGAVRMYNLMRRAAVEFDQILVVFSDVQGPPGTEVLELFVETVLVRRAGSHSLPFTGRPDVVEEFASPSFRAALEQTMRKWRPAIAQLEFTPMGQYADACSSARTLLVEHDVTFDLYTQLLATGENWELRRQLELWQRFETAAWGEVNCVVTMSEKDRALISRAGFARSHAAVIPNGADLERFRPGFREPDQRRLLFIGSFAHLPNVLATEFFLCQVWPQLAGATLHIIAGALHEYFLRRYADRVRVDLRQPGVEVEGFVADVRPAYERATLVIAPLVASAGTNIKILEAMAMGKAVISTPAGVNGLDLAPGEDFLLAKDASEMAEAIEGLLRDPAKRTRLEANARRRVERDFDWDVIARKQAELYREMLMSEKPGTA